MKKFKFTLTKQVHEQLTYDKLLLMNQTQEKIRLDREYIFNENAYFNGYSKILSGFNLFSIGFVSYSWSSFPLNTTIGNYCSIGAQNVVMGLQHPYTRFSTSAITYENNYFPNMQLNFIKHKLPLYKQNAINICDDVWIGAYCMLKPGITIGTGAVIGARSMVTKDVPPYAIVGGNPAKIIKMRFSDKLIEQLLVSEWFKYDIRQMAIPVNIDIEKFIDEFYKFKSQCRLIDKRNYIDTFRNLNIKIVEV